MKKSIVTIITLSALVLLMGCCACRELTSGSGTRLDSTIIEYRERTVIVPDTVYLDIPRQTAERETRDSISHLENDYALSDARINADGTLFHNLRTKPQKMPVVVETKIERRDSVIYKNREIEIPIPIERELGWWEKTSIRFFPYSLFALFLVCLYLFRKPILTLIRRFI